MVKHPKFKRPNMAINKRVKDRWRKPHGVDSKQRQKIAWAGATVNKGYRGQTDKRDLHPQGKRELLLRNLGELDKAGNSAKNFVIRLQSTLSKRNKELIRKKAAETGVKVLN